MLMFINLTYFDYRERYWKIIDKVNPSYTSIITRGHGCFLCLHAGSPHTGIGHRCIMFIKNLQNGVRIIKMYTCTKWTLPYIKVHNTPNRFAFSCVGQFAKQTYRIDIVSLFCLCPFRFRFCFIIPGWLSFSHFSVLIVTSQLYDVYACRTNNTRHTS